MNIYRNIDSKKLYTIERLVLDIKHLNRNAFAGIYATPYNWKGDVIHHNSKDEGECNTFVENNFKIVSNT